MPTPLVKSFAKQSGKDISTVERLWDLAKKSAKKQLGTDTGDRFYSLTTGILKKMLKIETLADEDAANTTSTANIATGQSGQYAPKLGISSKKCKNKKINKLVECLSIIESYGS